jgi:hypothetical protein
MAPPQASAAPAGADPKALAAFEVGFTEGQAKFDRGEYLEAARTWLAAAANLPEKTVNRDNRVAVYEYIVDAFMRGLAGSTEPEALREAVTALDAYVDGFTRSYGTETALSPKIVAARDEFRARLTAAEGAEKDPKPPDTTSDVPPGGGDELPPDEPPPPPGKPGLGLMVGGGVMIGLGLGAAGLAGFGAARGQSLERQFDDPANACQLAMPSASCQDLLDQGKTMNSLTIAGAVLAPLLVGGGVALLVVGLKRRQQPRQALAPALAPGFVGLTLRGRF